jgi:hypothetical protein
MFVEPFSDKTLIILRLQEEDNTDSKSKHTSPSQKFICHRFSLIKPSKKQQLRTVEGQVKVKAFTFTIFPIKPFTFSYLPLTITVLLVL